ncbi:MAG: hypothetical protein BWY82_02248 [Verrucomicrobia bacterium ADurb.Bin474]|nr:MAG: hypothetical protein BWY82_02248 [Verrucomicrobia bacterium ADurb.Bin474]
MPSIFKLHSSDLKSHLRIAKVGDASYSAIEIEAVVDIGHSRFTAHNHDVHFLGVPDFCHRVDQFIWDRSVSPSLEGTYDCHIRLSESIAGVHLSFCIGSSQCSGTGPTQDYRFTGVFLIDQEMLSEILKFFRSLAHE